jgi:hypothetical protein
MVVRWSLEVHTVLSLQRLQLIVRPDWRLCGAACFARCLLAQPDVPKVACDQTLLGKCGVRMLRKGGKSACLHCRHHP